MLGSEDAYRIVEDIRVATSFNDARTEFPPSGESADRLTELGSRIDEKQNELDAAIYGSANVGKLRDLNDQLALLIERQKLIARDKSQGIVSALDAHEMLR